LITASQQLTIGPFASLPRSQQLTIGHFAEPDESNEYSKNIFL
jgi:hypothetical protein